MADETIDHLTAGLAHGQSDVDENLIELNLQLTPAQRIEKHYRARMFVQRLRRIARERNGTPSPDSEAVE